MRTVDPELWCKRVKARRLVLARPSRLGRPPGCEAWLRASLGDAVSEFMSTCSVQSVRRFMSPHTGKWDSEEVKGVSRYHWMILLVIALFCGLLFTSLDLAELVGQPPLHISLQSTQHSIRHIPFPAVAICSYNVISEQALQRTTLLLASKDVNHRYTRADLRQNLLSFGSLLTLTLPTLDLDFMPFITTIGAGYRFNVTILMSMLAPTCQSMLVRCSWRAKITPCDRLFALRITSVGYCCVFNGRYEPVDYKTPPKILEMVGASNDLSVIVRDNPNDVACLRKPIMGTEVLIFDGSEFPMLEGGAVRVGMTWPNAAVYFPISTRQQRADPDLAYYTEAWRGCRLRRPEGEPHLRSYGWCLLDCRRRAVLQLCGCVPYTLQPRTGDLICSLNQLNCLHKHKEKFLYYYPYGSSTQEALSEESQDALYCEDCRPDCARPTYTILPSVVHIPQRFRSKLFNSQFTSGLPTEHNASILRFFYQTQDQHMYAVEGNTNWYETFASIVSQWMVLVGVSLIAVVELVFHLTVRWRYHYVRRRAIKRLL